MFGIGMQELLVLGIWFGFAFACSVVAENKGRSRLLWFFLGLFFNALALLILAVLGKAPKEGKDLTRCPFCAELIRREAIVCKHCGRELKKH